MKIETDPVTDLIVQSLGESFGDGQSQLVFSAPPEVGEPACLSIFRSSETLELASRAINPRVQGTEAWLARRSRDEQA